VVAVAVDADHPLQLNVCAAAAAAVDDDDEGTEITIKYRSS